MRVFIEQTTQVFIISPKILDRRSIVCFRDTKEHAHLVNAKHLSALYRLLWCALCFTCDFLSNGNPNHWKVWLRLGGEVSAAFFSSSGHKKGWKTGLVLQKNAGSFIAENCLRFVDWDWPLKGDLKGSKMEKWVIFSPLLQRSSSLRGAITKVSMRKLADSISLMILA